MSSSTSPSEQRDRGRVFPEETRRTDAVKVRVQAGIGPTFRAWASSSAMTLRATFEAMVRLVAEVAETMNINPATLLREMAHQMGHAATEEKTMRMMTEEQKDRFTRELRAMVSEKMTGNGEPLVVTEWAYAAAARCGGAEEIGYHPASTAAWVLTCEALRDLVASNKLVEEPGLVPRFRLPS